MNEIKTIHIGRQAFTIAVDAYGDLKKYLDALAQRIQDQEVLEEIELRMAELLVGRNGNAEAVIVKSDVAYLKDTLGQPSDFAEDGGKDAASEAQDLPRRFMRDPRGRILGGVASGVAAYFGIDPLWVRLAFVALTFASGFGILLYLILWAIMPEAKTSSDFLQMQGKPVTIESLADFSQHTELRSGAAKVGAVLVQMMHGAVKVLLWAIGIGMMVVGILGALATVIGTVFALTSSSEVFSGVAIFPVGAAEVVAVLLGALAGLVGCLFLAFVGASILAQKWRLPTWATAAVITLFFVSIGVAAPLLAASVSRIERRVEAARYTQTRSLEPFTAVTVSDADVEVRYEPGEVTSVAIQTFGTKDISAIETTVRDGVLTVDAAGFEEAHCKNLCMYKERPILTIQAPLISQIEVGFGSSFRITKPPTTDTAVRVVQQVGSSFSLSETKIDTLHYRADGSSLTFVLEGLTADSGADDFWNSWHGYGSLFTTEARQVVLAKDLSCDSYQPLLEVGSKTQLITPEGQAPLATNEFLSKATDEAASVYNCVTQQGGIR